MEKRAGKRDPDPLLRAVRRAAVRDGLLRPGDRVLAAVSGGPDSVALLDVLRRLGDELGIELQVASLDHGLRGARGAADLEFVGRTAERLGLPFHWERADVAALARQGGLSLEEAARQARYAFLGRIARRWGPGPAGPPRVAVGHTADDQAETVLMRIIEGTGVEGLAGMPPLREEDGWTLVRPLLTVTREEVEAYCRRAGLEFRVDETNLDRRFRRNLIRNEILPLLRRHNPRVREALVGLADVARRERAILEEETDEIAKALIDRGVPGGERPFAGLAPAGPVLRVEKAKFAGLGEGLRRRLVRRIVAELGGQAGRRQAGRAGVERAVSAAERLRVGGRVELGGGVVLEAGYRCLFFAAARTALPACGRLAPAAAAPVELAVPGRTRAPALGWVFRASRASRVGGEPGPEAATAGRGRDRLSVELDESELAYPLSVRTRRRGDALRPLGLGGTKKLSDLFIAAKVPRADREAWPLVVDGRDRIVWVVGLAVEERFAAGPEATEVLRLEAGRARSAETRA